MDGSVSSDGEDGGVSSVDDDSGGDNDSYDDEGEVALSFDKGRLIVKINGVPTLDVGRMRRGANPDSVLHSDTWL